MLMENHDCGHGPNEDYIRCPICVLQELDNAKLQIDEMKRQQKTDVYTMGEISKCRDEAFRQIDAEKRLYVQNDTYLRDQLNEKGRQVGELQKELAAVVSDGNRLADALVKSREEVVPLQDKVKESDRLNGVVADEIRDIVKGQHHMKTCTGATCDLRCPVRIAEHVLGLMEKRIDPSQNPAPPIHPLNMTDKEWSDRYWRSQP